MERGVFERGSDRKMSGVRGSDGKSGYMNEDTVVVVIDVVMVKRWGL